MTGSYTRGPLVIVSIEYRIDNTRTVSSFVSTATWALSNLNHPFLVLLVVPITTSNECSYSISIITCVSAHSREQSVRKTSQWLRKIQSLSWIDALVILTLHPPLALTAWKPPSHQKQYLGRNGSLPLDTDSLWISYSHFGSWNWILCNSVVRKWVLLFSISRILSLSAIYHCMYSVHLQEAMSLVSCGLYIKSLFMCSKQVHVSTNIYLFEYKFV